MTTFSVLCVRDARLPENDPVGLWLHRSKADSANAVEGERFSVHKNGSLEIRNTMKEDMGEYSCFAQNTEGKVAISSTFEVKGMRNQVNGLFLIHKSCLRRIDVVLFLNHSADFHSHSQILPE